MVKKLFSKRSGFTLVEIVVAFAVFAIMAAMILQILNLVLYEKQNNARYVEKMQKQEELIAEKGRVGEYTDENKTQDIKLTFGDKGEFETGYEMKFPYDDDGDVQYEDGLAYFIGPGSEEAQEDGNNNQNNIYTDAKAYGSGQGDRLDIRISGTNGISAVNVYRVVKDPTYPKPGARYFFEVSASAPDMAGEIVPYAQYKMYFFMKDKYKVVDYVDVKGNTLKRKYPVEAQITNAGYVNSTNLAWDTNTCLAFDKYSNTGSYNKYVVKSLGDNCIGVSTPFIYGNSDGGYVFGEKRGIRFKASNTTRFFVEFKEDPELTRESFGEDIAGQDNVVDDDSMKVSYTPVPHTDDDGNFTGNFYVNIFGAYEFKTQT